MAAHGCAFQGLAGALLVPWACSKLRHLPEELLRQRARPKARPRGAKSLAGHEVGRFDWDALNLSEPSIIYASRLLCFCFAFCSMPLQVPSMDMVRFLSRSLRALSADLSRLSLQRLPGGSECADHPGHRSRGEHESLRRQSVRM